MNLRDKWLELNKDKLHAGEKYTKSTVFLLPIIGVSFKDFIYDKSYLINCHIKSLEIPELIVILSNEEYEPVVSLIQRLTNHSLFSESWTDNRNTEIVLSYDLSKWNTDYNRFIKGKYSSFSEPLKDILIKKYGATTAGGFMKKASVYDIIKPTETSRKALAKELRHDWPDDIKEVMDIPDMNVEKYYTTKELKKIYGFEQGDIIRDNNF